MNSETDMNLKSLLVTSDERAVRVLRSVLSELEIDVEHCPDRGSAAKKLAQLSFGAVIIDCKDETSFSLLRSIRAGQQNSKSVAIAIVDARTKLQAAFTLGANFVIYEPISAEKAKSSFRAARALMKRERRRSLRLPVNIAAYFRFQNGDGEHASISGLSEGGMSVRFPASGGKKSGLIGFCFALPDTTTVIEASGMIAWQDSRRRAGIKFVTLPEGAEQSLREWLRLQSGEKRDPPIQCSLMGLSPSGCFLQTQSPFPAQTRVEVLLRATDCSTKVEGKVRIMDPELGMGVEFLNRTIEQRERLEKLIQLTNSDPEAVAEVLVEPEGIDWEDGPADSSERAASPANEDENHDPLLKLFRTGGTFSREQFLLQLQKQHVAGFRSESDLDLAEPIVHQRREPRILVSLPVQVESQDHQESADASLVDVSHHGARVGGVPFSPKVGEVVHLVAEGCNARFRVIWVGDPGTPQEGQIGLQSLTTDK